MKLIMHQYASRFVCSGSIVSKILRFVFSFSSADLIPFFGGGRPIVSHNSNNQFTQHSQYFTIIVRKNPPGY